MALVKFGNNENRDLKPWYSDVFENFFNDSFVSDRLTSRVPAVNIGETDHSFHIELAAPGLKKEDFKISLDNNVLSISVEKKEENAQENKRFNRKEYCYTSFVRSFTLPETADYANIEAEYQDGVLHIDVAKKEEAKNLIREISIK